MTTTPAYLSLGSNLGDRTRNLRDAIERLRAFADVRTVSSFYETEPVEFTDQPWFLNCVVRIETTQTPRQLLDALLALEASMGRRRIQKKGPRLIDVDILLFGNWIVQEPGIAIPHPALAERRFVPRPLTELAPGLVHPALHKTMRQLLDALPPGQQVRKLQTDPSNE